jgi:hypothetical protein
MNHSLLFLLPGLLCPLLALALIIGLVVFIVRAVSKAGSSPVSGLPPVSRRVLTEMGDDGFWIVSAAANPNALLHYYYWINGIRHTGQIPYQPNPTGRQFVYTGNRPERADIIRILEATEDDAASLLPPAIAAESAFFAGTVIDTPDTASPPASSSSFPAAY